MACWAWVAPPSFDPGYCPAKSWNFIKSGYEILKLSIKCTRLENIYNYSTHSSSNNSDWLKAFRDRANTQFSTKFAAKLSLSVLLFLSLFFEISSLMWSKRVGAFQCCLFLTLRITLLCIQIVTNWEWYKFLQNLIP
jgi:hypothetical protein